MASSNMIVLNSKFNPFSYQELLAPVQAADTEHKLIEEEYGKLDTLSNVWKTRLNKDLDKKSYAQYSSYIDGLQQQSTDLAKNGLNPISRKSLLTAKSDYTGNIVPIEEAFNTRMAKSKEQNDLKARDNSIEFQTDFSKSSVDDFLGNPTLTSKYVSGNSIMTDVANQAKQFADQQLINTTLSPKSHGMLEYVKKYGIDAKIINEVINNPNADAEMQGIAGQLQNIVNNGLKTSGVTEWKNEEVLNKMRGYGNKGLYSALGKTDSSIYEDPLAKEARARAAQQVQINEGSKYIPSTNSYFDINSGEGKVLNGIKNKLFDSKGNAYTKYFGMDGNKNPIKEYENVQQFKSNSLKNYNYYIDQLSQKYMTNDKVNITEVNGQKVLSGPGLTGQMLKEYQIYQRGFREQTAKNYNANTLSKDEYEKLKNMGININDNSFNIRTKVADHIDLAQQAFNNYDLKLSDKSLQNADKDIKFKLNKHISTLVPIDAEYNLKTGTEVDSKDFLKGLKNEKESNVVKVEFSPKLGGNVVHTQGGKMFLMTTGYSNEVDNVVNSKLKGTQNNGKGIEYALRQANDYTLPIKQRKLFMKEAKDLSQEVTQEMIPFYSGFTDSQDASVTSQVPGQAWIKH